MFTKTLLQTLAIAGVTAAAPMAACSLGKRQSNSTTPGSSTGGSDSINEGFVNKGKLYVKAIGIRVSRCLRQLLTFLPFIFRYYGNIADPGTLSNGNTQSILNADFGQITCEVSSLQYSLAFM
jgi:hypothetical protein